MQFNIKHQAAAGGAVPREHHRHLSQPDAGRGQKLVRVYLPLQKIYEFCYFDIYIDAQ